MRLAASLTGMQVRFERTGDRRYAVAVLRTQHGDLRMDPAPGYSDLIPHDLVHLVVEEEFGLRQGSLVSLPPAAMPGRSCRPTSCGPRRGRVRSSDATGPPDATWSVRRISRPRSTRAGCDTAVICPAVTTFGKTLRQPTSATASSRWHSSASTHCQSSGALSKSERQ